MDMLALGGVIACVHHLKPIVLNIQWSIRTAAYALFIWVMINAGSQPTAHNIMSQLFTNIFSEYVLFSGC